MESITTVMLPLMKIIQIWTETGSGIVRLHQRKFVIVTIPILILIPVRQKLPMGKTTTVMVTLTRVLKAVTPMILMATVLVSAAVTAFLRILGFIRALQKYVMGLTMTAIFLRQKIVIWAKRVIGCPAQQTYANRGYFALTTTVA
jgi:hypothetical protein